MNNLEDDLIEKIRRAQQAIINQTPVGQLQIEGRTWTTEELTKEFDVLGFAAPYVMASEKSTGKKGSLLFKHSPRIYYDWAEDQ